MKTSSVKALNDLIISSFLTKFRLVKTSGQKSLEVAIHPEKKYLLQDYINQNHLENYVDVHLEKNVFYIKPSFMLEQKLKDWTSNGKVTAINPADLHTRTFLFWIALFAVKSNYSVVIETELPPEIQETLTFLFSRSIQNCSIASSGKVFHFESFLELYLLSVKHNRPYVESGELNLMLSDKEKRRLRKIIADEKEEGEVVF